MLLVAFAAASANAQTFLTVPTTSTLWGGTQDFSQFGLASMTAPGSGVILTGTRISDITGKPIRYLWYGDPSNGLCRMDPEVDAVIPPVAGIGGHQNNILSCVGAIQAAAFTPGQVAFDASTNTLYVPDVGRTTAGVIRVHYDPNADGGRGGLDPVTVRSLIGTTVNRNAAGGCPQITDPKTGTKVPIVPDAAAIGPDGNLYVGNIRTGSILRIKNPATFDPSSDANCKAGIDIPILSADERVTAGHTFGLGWIGHTLLGNDNIAPWVLFNADQCLTPTNGNRICGAPAVSGAPMPTEVLAAFVPGPQAAGTTDAQYPNFPGNTWFVASFPNVTKITNIQSTSNMTVQTNYGGTFSFITGITTDPQDLNNKTVYVGVDSTQGSINGAAGMYQIVEGTPAPLPPLSPSNVSATAQSVVGASFGSASVTWIPQLNSQPITSYTVKTYLASTPNLPPSPSGLPDVTLTPNSVGALATSTTVGGLAYGTSYQFAVVACNSTGCSPLSGFSNPVTPVAVTAPPAPTTVVGLAGNSQAAVAWTQSSNGGSPITSSTVSAFTASGGNTLVGTVVVNGSGTGATVTGLTNGQCYIFSVHSTNAAGTSPESALSAAVCLPIPTGVDQSLTMSAPASINPGSILTYSMVVTNNGPANVVQSLISDSLPAPLASFTSSQGVCQGAPGGLAFSCNLGSLVAGGSATVTVSVNLGSLTGTVSNSATVSAADVSGQAVADLTTANNSAGASTVINSVTTNVTTDLQVTGSSNNGNPVHGTPVTYTWQIKNALGTVNAPGVVFTNTTSAATGATLAITSVTTTLGSCTVTTNTSLTCNLGTINGGGAAVVTVTAVPSAAEPANSYSSTGKVSFTGTDSNAANNSFTVFIGAQ
jgi:uncharacterized repeat protein (TIGR01451 family)